MRTDYDKKDPHFKMCVAKANAIKKQKDILDQMEATHDKEVARQKELAVKRSAEKAVLEAKVAKPQKALVNKVKKK